MKMILKEEMSAYQDLLINNRLFRRLSPARQGNLIIQAVNFGADTAHRISTRHGKLADIDDIRELIQDYGAHLEIKQNHFTTYYLAEYEENTAGIECYLGNIVRLEQCLDQRGKYHPDPYPLLVLCILHEMFHHIEALGNMTTCKCYVMVKFLLSERRCSPVALRDVAAHSFVKEMLDLEKSPVLFRFDF